MDKQNVRVGVGIMVFREGGVLLGHRHPDRDKASSELHGEGMWTMPGGKMHFGEKIIDAAKRELTEETGLEANRLEMVSVSNEIRDDAHFVTIGFLYKDCKGEPRVMEPEEITEWKFFPLKSLPNPIFPPSKKLLQNYIDREVYKGD
jgi:8-oxo-dGTP diphosphatase